MAVIESICAFVREYWMWFLLAYAVVNIVAFCMYAADKKKAKKGEWRTSEASLILAALLFGGLGALLGMVLCRHKTKHAKFVICVPLFLIIQLVIVGCIIFI